MLDDLGLIHMNGRIYDPGIGRFLNPDPLIQNPYDLQSYNRYSYCQNNPLKYTDPTGYYSMFGGLLEGDDGKSWWGNTHEFLNNAGNGASGGAAIGANALYLGVPDALGITQTSALTGKEFETAHRISPAISTASSVIVGEAAIKLATTASGAVPSAIKGADTGVNAVKALEASAPKAALTTELQANVPAAVSSLLKKTPRAC